MTIKTLIGEVIDTSRNNTPAVNRSSFEKVELRQVPVTVSFFKNSYVDNNFSG